MDHERSSRHAGFLASRAAPAADIASSRRCRHRVPLAPVTLPLSLIAATLATALPAAEPARAADILIGVAAPLNGPDAVFGTQVADGVDLAVADLDASDGLLGRKARVEAQDDGSDAKKAVAVAKVLLADKASLVVGDLTSATTVPASVLYGEGKLIEITPSAIAPVVTERGIPTLFRIGGREDGQIEAAVRFLLARHAKVAIVSDRTATGKAVADGVRAGLAAAGVRDSFYGNFESGTRALAPLVSRIRASGATIVFFGGSPGDAGALAKQMRDAGSKATLMGGIAMASDEFAASAGAAADGALVVFSRDPSRGPAAADLVRRLGPKSQVGSLFFNSYAAVQIYRQAATLAGTLDAAAVAAVMRSGREFKTVLGPVAFDRNGDMTPQNWIVYVWHKGASGRMVFDEPAKS